MKQRHHVVQFPEITSRVSTVQVLLATLAFSNFTTFSEHRLLRFFRNLVRVNPDLTMVFGVYQRNRHLYSEPLNTALTCLVMGRALTEIFDAEKRRYSITLSRESTEHFLLAQSLTEAQIRDLRLIGETANAYFAPVHSSVT